MPQITFKKVQEMPPKDGEMTFCYGLQWPDEFFNWHKAFYEENTQTFWGANQPEEVCEVKYWFPMPADPREDHD